MCAYTGFSLLEQRREGLWMVVCVRACVCKAGGGQGSPKGIDVTGPSSILEGCSAAFLLCDNLL